MNIVDLALSIATDAHKGQTDRGGNDYINHPVFVASLVDTEDEKVTALLHDVIEDTPVTIDDLRNQGIPENVLDALQLLSKKPGTPYFPYIERIKTNPLATAVKLADLTHNSDISRIPEPSENDSRRVRKYQRAMAFLRDTEFVSFDEFEKSL